MTVKGTTSFEGAGNPDEFPMVSVIIPVYNDLKRLEICLDALQVQSYPKDRYEVVVVDNGSERDIEGALKKYEMVRFGREDKRGSYAARNRGLDMAGGELIAFTDSDCIPAEEWMEKGVKAFLAVPGCGLVAGGIEFFFSDPENPTAVELYDSIVHLKQKNYVENGRYGATANVFTSRKVIDAVGPFNDRLKSGGDSEWGKRVFSHGYKVAYADDARVFHPARRSFGQIRRKTLRLAGGTHERLEENIFTYLIRLPLIVMDNAALIYGVWRDKRLKGIGRKFKVSALALMVKSLQFFERIRLNMGGRSRG
ncbi:MAG: glycosyltransferase [Thermodesulfobacteriota bacterium]